MFVPTHSYTHGPRYPMNPSTQQQQPASQPALMLFRLDLCPFSIQQAEWVDLPLIYFPLTFSTCPPLDHHHSTFCFTTNTEREYLILPKPTSSAVASPRSPLDLTCVTCDRGSLSSVPLYPLTLKDCLDTRARLTLFLCKNPWIVSLLTSPVCN